LAREIVDRLAAGESLRSICRLPHMPDERTVRRWKADDVDADFTAAFEEAREIQAHRWFEEIIELADESKQATSMHVVQSYRLRMDARRWVASRILPDHYGDKLQVDHGNQKNVHLYIPQNGRLELSLPDKRRELVNDGTALEVEQLEQDDSV
jgi:hypothetical protein